MKWITNYNVIHGDRQFDSMILYASQFKVTHQITPSKNKFREQIFYRFFNWNERIMQLYFLSERKNDKIMLKNSTSYIIHTDSINRNYS